MKYWLAVIAAGLFGVGTLSAQILLSRGTYSQTFDSLPDHSTAWTNNLTLPGWYASRSGADITNILVGAGSSTHGGLYSFGGAGAHPVADRALGSLASGSADPVAFGLRFTNDTALTVTNIRISVTGEQWRNGGSGNPNTLTFAYATSRLPITHPAGAANWTSFPALNFISPTVGGNASTLDGILAANRRVFSAVPLAGVTVSPGAELFLRWADANDPGSDDGLAIDDLTVTFETTTNAPIANPPPVVANTNNSITLMTYNVKGNGATDWSTNAAQVQAIGRELLYLKPDIITFNEIPYTNTWQMANWVKAFLPGYYLATNSVTDGYIRSVIASRFPIQRSQRWLAHADLNPFGYTNANFTRDLFEAQVAVPGWPQPLLVFTTHLKSTSGSYADSAAKRAAEAAAITNFLATNILAMTPPQPFILAGDMNESDTNATAIQELVSEPTTLRLTHPVNPFTGSINTFSIQGSLSERIDYIFPCTLLFSNTVHSEVFRTDLLANLPANLYSNDDATASDHLPVLMTFANPFAQPFRLTVFSRSHQTTRLTWQAVPGGVYRVETSSNLLNWTALASHLTSTNYSGTFVTNLNFGGQEYFRVRTD